MVESPWALAMAAIFALLSASSWLSPFEMDSLNGFDQFYGRFIAPLFVAGFVWGAFAAPYDPLPNTFWFHALLAGVLLIASLYIVLLVRRRRRQPEQTQVNSESTLDGD